MRLSHSKTRLALLALLWLAGGLAVGLVLGLALLAWGDPTTHALPSETRQRQQWHGDVVGGFVVSGCLPSVPASGLTLGAFACEAYVKDTTTGEVVYARDSGNGLGPVSGTSPSWVLVRADTSTTPASWTCQAGTRYCHRQSSSLPTTPTKTLIVAKLTVAAGNITAVGDWRNFDPASATLVNVERWGARSANSATTNATAIQAALNYAANAGAGLYFPDLYPMTSLSVAAGVRALWGPGGLQATGQFGSVGGLIELAGTVDTLKIEGLRLVMSTSGTGAKYGIYGACSSCVIAHNTLTNFEDINGHAGIYLTAGSAYTRLVGNQINLVQPPLTAGHTAQGIVLYGTPTDLYGGYFAGVGTCGTPSTFVHDMTVTGNVIYGGSHGVWGVALAYSSISGNTIRYSWHRGTELQSGSTQNTVAGNSYTEFYSSAVNLSYCANYNTIVGNTAYSTTANGQAPFLAYVGTTDNVISDNNILVSGTATVYGVYLAINSSRNLVKGNKITGPRYAGIHVQGDWVDPLPGGAAYSLAVAAASSPSGQWAYGNCANNSLLDNYIFSPTGAAAAGIAVASIGATGGVTGTVVKGNHVESTSFLHQWHVYEATALVTTVWLEGNTWNTGFFSMGARGLAHYKTVTGNYALDGPIAYTFADGDTTPSVAIGSRFAFANTAPTNVTNFDDGNLTGREIEIQMDSNTTLVYDVNKIRLWSGANFTGDTNAFIAFRNIGGVWYELWRKYNPTAIGATLAFASLPASGNGTIYYCSDCTIASPCAGAGGGAIAKRIGGAWVCN
jgi:hypothetical protein